jgi:hypothetical protein
MKHKASTLLELIEKLLHTHPEYDNWHPEKVKNNVCLHTLLMKIEACIKAFMPDIYRKHHLANMIGTISSGKFIYERTMEDYQKNIAVMDKKMKHKNIVQNEHDTWTTEAIKFNFDRLLELKIKLHGVAKFNSGIMEISYPYYYAYLTSQPLIDSLRTKEIDTFLALVLDPKGTWFTQAELIENFGFPVEVAGDDDWY